MIEGVWAIRMCTINIALHRLKNRTEGIAVWAIVVMRVKLVRMDSACELHGDYSGLKQREGLFITHRTLCCLSPR